MLHDIWLFEEVVGALAHRTHGELDVAVAGHEDDGNVGVDFANAGKEGHSIHAGHSNVGHHDTVEAWCDEIERALRRGTFLQCKSGKIERLGCSPARLLLIVDEQHDGRLHSAASRAALRIASSSIVNRAPPSG